MRSFLILALAAIACAQNYADFQQNDFNVLNYALTLENLENRFYAEALGLFSATDFMNFGYNATVYNYIGLIYSHESTHVATLSQVLSSYNITPNAQCNNYNFTAYYGTNVTMFIGLASVLENTGVRAYDGAITGISNPVYQQVAATIATIEARHAAYLNQLAQINPWNSQPFDDADTPSDILTQAGVYVSNCSNTQFPPLIPQNATFAANNNITNQTAASTNDLNALIYASFLESIEANFYAFGLQNIPNTTFYANGFNQSVLDYQSQITAYEFDHLAFLNGTLYTLGGSQPGTCIYNFSGVLDTYTAIYGNNATAYFVISAMLQTVGTSAFDGAVNGITNLDVKAGAATIATIEGRFSAFTNQLVGLMPFNGNSSNNASNAFDAAFTPAQAFSAASPFITNCTFDIRNYFPIPANFSLAQQLSDNAVAQASTSASTSSSTGSSATGTSAGGATSNGASTNGGSTNGASTNGASTNGGSTNGGSTSNNNGGTSGTSSASAIVSSAAIAAILAVFAL